MFPGGMRNAHQPMTLGLDTHQQASSQLYRLFFFFFFKKKLSLTVVLLWHTVVKFVLYDVSLSKKSHLLL